jgi:hypothetical protein
MKLYRSFVSRLDDEIGAEPSPSLVAMVGELSSRASDDPDRLRQL